MFLTTILYVPDAKPVKFPVFCQVLPLLIEYSTVPPVAVTVIVPLSVPQLVGSAFATFEIAVGVGASMTIVFPV